MRIFPSHATLFVITKHIWAYAAMASGLFQEPLSGRLLGIPDNFLAQLWLLIMIYYILTKLSIIRSRFLYNRIILKLYILGSKTKCRNR